MKEKYRKQIDCIMNEFDFNNVLHIMKKTKWTWGEDGVPAIQEITATAQHHLEQVVNEKLVFSSSGGFTAMKRKGRLILFFGIDSLIINDIYALENK